MPEWERAVLEGSEAKAAEAAAADAPAAAVEAPAEAVVPEPASASVGADNS